ncbi:MAG: hypothetical protein DI551_09135, partial [Micavibrio aeruginosavorus]
MKTPRFITQFLGQIWSSKAVAANDGLDDFWPAFRARYAADYQDWRNLPPSGKSRAVPHITLGEEANHDAALTASVDEIFPDNATKLFLRTTGVQIWASANLAPLADKLGLTETAKEYFHKRLDGAAGLYIPAKTFGNDKSVLFYINKTLSGAAPS